jgi:hypothetical protein
VALILSCPSRFWRDEKRQSAWGHEKDSLDEWFDKLELQVKIEDLSGLPGDEAVAQACNTMCGYDQVLGIAHVHSWKWECTKCNQKLDLEADIWSLWSLVEKELDELKLAAAKALCNPANPALLNQVELPCSNCGGVMRWQPSFEVGEGGRLGPQELENVGRALITRNERMTIFLGCSTLSTGLDRVFLSSGISTVFLSTPATVRFSDMIMYIKALICTIYGGKGDSPFPRNRILEAYLKLKEYHAISERLGQRFVLVLEGAAAESAEAIYYIALPDPNLMQPTPQLDLVRGSEIHDAVEEMVLNLGSTSGGYPIVIDAPRSLRNHLWSHLKGKPVMWVAQGSTCQSVGEAVLGTKSTETEYGVGFVEGSFLVLDELVKHFPILHVENLKISEVKELQRSPGKVSQHNFLNFLSELAKEGRMIIASARPKSWVRERM